MGNLLFHLTRTSEKPIAATNRTGTTFMNGSASSVLEKILIEGRILGSTQGIRGGYKCVCFTESPMAELAAVLSLSKIAADDHQRPRYEPFGIAVPKDWLFSKGGRHAIYQPGSEFELLPEELRYRHVRYEPHRGIDHTWEREWRIKTEQLVLDPKKTLVVVPTAEEAYELTYGHSEPEPVSYDDEGFVNGVFNAPKWLAVSLDLFGFHDMAD